MIPTTPPKRSGITPPSTICAGRERSLKSGGAFMILLLPFQPARIEPADGHYQGCRACGACASMPRHRGVASGCAASFRPPFCRRAQDAGARNGRAQLPRRSDARQPGDYGYEFMVIEEGMVDVVRDGMRV